VRFQADGTHEADKILFKRSNKAGVTELKVKWKDLNTAHATWMVEDVFRAKLGEKTADELLEAYNKWSVVEEEWVGGKFASNPPLLVISRPFFP
jgi:hypothetical protein